MFRRAAALAWCVLWSLGPVATTGHACVDHGADVLRPGNAVDGDTLRVRLLAAPLPAPLGDELRLRVRGVDCPEKHHPRCDDERRRALQAHAYTQRWLRDRRVEASPSDIVVRICGWNRSGRRVRPPPTGPPAPTNTAVASSATSAPSATGVGCPTI